MRLEDYPRPDGDTGIGFDWFPDFYHYEDRHLGMLLPRLKEMGASWLGVMSDLSRPIPRSFLQALVAEKIEPVVHVYTPYVTFVDQEDLYRLCNEYASSGVHYIYLFDEPNLKGKWAKWEHDGLVEHFAEYLSPCLETICRAEGLVPVFSPLSPGGDSWDLNFLSDCFELMKRQGKEFLWEKMAVGIHNYAYNKPLTWGKGGKVRWGLAQHSHSGMEDHLGFWQFEWYDEIVRQAVGHSLPIISCGNGVLLGDHASHLFPPIDRALHAQRNLEMAETVMRGEVPDYFFNNAFWLLTAEGTSPFAAHRWFHPDGRPILSESIQALANMVKGARNPQLAVPETIRVLQEEEVVLMDMEEYLKGVLPIEMGRGAPLEALKAQAVAARSYAAYAVAHARHTERDADICTASHCQGWSPQHYPHCDQAVDETSGLVAAYGGELVRAYYFSRCDGRTRASEEVWTEALPYCRAVSCVDAGPEMEGHGVGMCQAGAVAMANQGAGYREILRHYYTGINIAEPVFPATREITRRSLANWPRPGNDSGLGIHIGLNFGDAALGTDLGRALEMGLKWVLMVPTDEIQLRRAVRLFWSAGIMSVVRPYCLIDRVHDFVIHVRVMLEIGAPPYIQIYNEPADVREWASGRPDLPLFVRKWVDNALAVYDAGGYPGLQVLGVDLLREVIAETRRRNVMHLWERVWFCPHSYGLNHPPNYPRDDVNQNGMPVQDPNLEYVAPIDYVNRWRETDKNPGQTIHQDYNCVLGFLAFAKVFEDELGFVPPMIVGEGGWQYGSSQDRRYPRVGDYLHAKYHEELFRWFKDGRLSNGDALPDYLFAVCPWILSGIETDAWYSSTMGTREATISAVKSLQPFVRAKPSPAPVVPPTPTPPEQPEAKSHWKMSVERQIRPDIRGIAGRLPQSGIRVTVSDPWGNSTNVISGTKAEYGPGGFEVRVWADGLYTIRFLDQTFQERVQGDFLILTFTQESEQKPREARLASDWMGRKEAETLLKDLEAKHKGVFTLDGKEAKICIPEVVSSPA